MKERVTQPGNAWLVGLAVVAVAVLYFALLGTSDFDEPGDNLIYDLAAFEELDNIDTAYEEVATIPCAAENPRALAAVGDRIYLGAENVVVVFDSEGAEQARYPVQGSVNCLAVAADGTLYAGAATAITVLAPDGAVRARWGDFSARSYFTSLALKDGELYAADAGNRVVYRLDDSGQIQTRIGLKDPARDVPGLEVPSPYLDIATNPDGDLWVVNPGKLGLEQYREDGSLVTSWYRPTVLALDGFPGCCNPTHVAFGSKGQLYTAEKGMVRVKAFEVTAGGFEGLVAPSEAFPQEQSLRDIAVDARDRILMLDPKRAAIRVFARKEIPSGTAS